jgi:hypothetical protein
LYFPCRAAAFADLVALGLDKDSEAGRELIKSWLTKDILPVIIAAFPESKDLLEFLNVLSPQIPSQQLLLQNLTALVSLDPVKLKDAITFFMDDSNKSLASLNEFKPLLKAAVRTRKTQAVEESKPLCFCLCMPKYTVSIQGRRHAKSL